MSTPPLKPSSRKKNDYTKVGELYSVYRLLNSQDSFETQLCSVIDILKNNFLCKIYVWLSDSLLKAIEMQGNTLNDLMVRALLPTMEKALSEKRIIVHPESDNSDNLLPKVIASPIVVDDNVWAVLQIEKVNSSEFTITEFRFVENLLILLSININQLQYIIENKERISENEHLISITQLNQSILSNLDRDSLLNSAISLLYQQYNFTRVSIYTYQDDKKDRFISTGISKNGIETGIYKIDQKSSEPLVECISKKEIIVINDRNHDNQFTKLYHDDKIQSELFLPLLHGEQVIGVLDLCDARVNIFTPAIINQYKLVANTISIALRNADVFQSELLGRHIAERLHEVIGELSVDTSFEEVVDIFLNEISNFIEYDATAVWLLDNSVDNSGIEQFPQSFHLEAFKINDVITKSKELIQADGINDLMNENIVDKELVNDLFMVHSWLNDVINSRSIGIRDPDSPYEPLGYMLGFNSDYSAIGMPLIVKNQVTGCLVLIHRFPEKYDNKSRYKASVIANYASIAIENVRLYSVAHDQAWISTVLLQIAEATQSITNIDELLETTVDILPGLIGVDACAIFLWDPFTEAFIDSRSNGFEDEQASKLQEWDISTNTSRLHELLKDSKLPIVLNSDSITEQTTKIIFEYYDLEKDLLVLFPLASHTSLNGALLIDFTGSNLEINSSQEIWDEKYALIQGAAHQVAIAIENLQLIKSQEEEAYISVALLQVAQAIVSLNKLDEILGTIVRITPILVGVKRCIIFLWDETELEFTQSQYFGFSKSDLEPIGNGIKRHEFPFIDAIHKSNQVLYHLLETDNSPILWSEISIRDCFAVEEANSATEGDYSIKIDMRSLNTRERLLFGFPISVKGENLGVMVIEEEDHIKGSPSQHIREKRIEIVKGITQQAAIAIKNELLQKEAVKSEIMERELQLAREIQTAFLPEEIPQIPGWDFAVKWQPARQVGGDFYDILKLDHERMGFVIADVADKGMPAALFMTLIRTLLRAAAKDKSSPSAVLKQVNDLLIPDTKNGMFVTVFYGVLNLPSGKFVYANAGHNPPILKHKQEAALVELTRTTMALGIFSDIEIEEREDMLQPGDWLMMYTDGVTEAFSDKEEMFGTERLYDLLLGHEFVDSTTLVNVVENKVIEFINGSDLSDDMTLTAIFRNKE